MGRILITWLLIVCCGPALALATPRDDTFETPQGTYLNIGDSINEKTGQVGGVSNEYWVVSQHGTNVYIVIGNSLKAMGVDRLTLRIFKSDGSGGDYGTMYDNETLLRDVVLETKPAWWFTWSKVTLEPGFYNVYIYNASGKKWIEQKLHLVDS